VAGERPNRIGEVIGDRFRVDELIGKGAYAEVYRALDVTTSAFVALKILRHTYVNDSTTKARFIREAEVQSKLRHRNVAALLATGVTAKYEPYIVVELLRGKTLRGVIKGEGRVSPVRAASYAWQTLAGLSAVHAAGILHRDLKPANIMLEPSPGPVERVVLIDFGFATFEGAARMTMQGTVVGSLAYLAPERLTGEEADARADLYAAGVILYELLVGQPPFNAKDDFALIDQQVNDEPARVRTLDPSLPQSLDDVIARALEKHPADRYQSANDMAAALEHAAQAIAPRSA
jgi:serine/threonine-protein kinase